MNPNRTRRLLRIVVLACAVFGLVACERRPAEERNPAPSSNLTITEARAAAHRARDGNPFQYIATVAPTGSMTPVLDSRTVVLMEAYTGQTLHAGDLVVFNRGDISHVFHRVVEVDGDTFFAAGDSSHHSDGWFPRTAIRYRAVALFFSTK